MKIMGVYAWRLVLCVIDNRGKCGLRFIENVASKASCRRTESICRADRADRYFARI